jgi:RNA polymerase sigma-70 factor (ECF subfamily)
MTFQELYDDQFEFVWRTLRRLGVPESDLPDVVQDVFVVVHRRLGDFEERGHLAAWLFRICLHQARDRRRKPHVHREVSNDTAIGAESDGGPNPAETLERSESRDLFEAALREMDLNQRAVFALFEIDGLSGQDIASLLEIPLGTVHSRLRLAREAFRRGVLRAEARLQRSRRLAEGKR